MSTITEAQKLAINNNAGRNANYLAAQAETTGQIIVESPTSGTAFQVSTTHDAILYIEITTAAALAVAMGPTSSVAGAIAASETIALSVVTLFVPAGWFVKLTGTMADVVVTAVLR